MDFKLLKDVSFSKEEYLPGKFRYNIRLKKLGALGQIEIRGNNEGYGSIDCLVVREEDDPKTKTRKAIFEPIAKSLTDSMEKAVGGAPKNVVSFPPKHTQEKHLIQTKYMPFPKCQNMVAILVFANEAYTPDQVEDYAIIAYSKVKEENLQAWIIDGMHDEYPKPTAKAYVLKVWPKREKIKLIHPDDFNPMLEKILEKHCS